MNKVTKVLRGKVSTNQKQSRTKSQTACTLGHARSHWDPAFLPLTASRPLPTLDLQLRSLSLPSGKVLIILQISTPLYNYWVPATPTGIRTETVSLLPSSFWFKVWAPFLRSSSSYQLHLLRIHLFPTYLTDPGANTAQDCKCSTPKNVQNKSILGHGRGPACGL